MNESENAVMAAMSDVGEGNDSYLHDKKSAVDCAPNVVTDPAHGC